MEKEFNGYQGNNDFDIPSDPERKEESNEWLCQGNCDRADIMPPGWSGWI